LSNKTDYVVHMTINLDTETRASTEFGYLGIDTRVILKGISNICCGVLDGCGYEDNIKIIYIYMCVCMYIYIYIYLILYKFSIRI